MSNKKRVGFLIFVIMISLFSFLPVVYAQYPTPPSTPTGTSVPPNCFNGVMDVGESGIDCGGVCPYPCSPASPTQATVPATCSNGIQDSGESGVDCGGVCPNSCFSSGGGGGGGGSGGGGGGGLCPPPKCVFNWTCGNWAVCIDGVQKRTCSNVGTCPNDCSTSTYIIPATQKSCAEGPTCFDSIKNQDESDADCGGICIFQNQKCRDGRMCNGKNSNCFSNYCDPVSGRCSSTMPTCSDSIQNQGETNVDCGGPCPPCQSCNDGILNGQETGIDCGGSCQNQNCCSNGQKDYSESAADCGGNCANKCGIGKSCWSNNDCYDGNCLNGYCTSAMLPTPEQPAQVKGFWVIIWEYILPWWWILLLLFLLLLLLLFMGNRYYEYYAYKKTVSEELPLPPVPPSAAIEMSVEEDETMAVATELPPFPEIQEEEKEEVSLSVPQLAMPLSLPPKIQVKAEPKVYKKHYREMNLPIYVEKEIYKKIQEDMPLLSSALLKQSSEIYQDLMDLHYHKTTDRRKLHDAIESIQKELAFMDNFLFERGKKQHRIKFEE